MVRLKSDSQPVFVMDIGSASVRVMVGIGCEDGSIDILYDAGKMSRLAEGLVPGGLLAPESAQRTLRVIEELWQPVAAFRPSRGRCLGTQCFRTAQDGSRFAKKIEAFIGTPVTILTIQQEGRLAWIGSSDLIQSGDMLLDLGGGSTELVTRDSKGAIEVRSIPWGAGSVYVPFSLEDSLRPDQQSELLEKTTRIAAQWSQHARGSSGERLICLGGTATCMAALNAGIGEYVRGKVHGTILDRSTLHFWFRELAGIPALDRQKKIGLEPGRETIIVSGLALLLGVSDAVNVQKLLISETGIRYGCLKTLLYEIRHSVDNDNR